MRPLGSANTDCNGMTTSSPPEWMYLNVFCRMTSMGCKQPSMDTRQQLSSVHFSQGLPAEVESVEAVVQAQQPASLIDYRSLVVRSITVNTELANIAHETLVRIARHYATR